MTTLVAAAAEARRALRTVENALRVMEQELQRQRADPERPLPTLKLMLTTKEAALESGISRNRIYAAINTGELNSVKVGRWRRIRRADLEQYVASLPGEPVNGPGST